MNTNSRRPARERERQNDAHGIVRALAERTNCIATNCIKKKKKKKKSKFSIILYKIFAFEHMKDF